MRIRQAKLFHRKPLPISLWRCFCCLSLTKLGTPGWRHSISGAWELPAAGLEPFRYSAPTKTRATSLAATSEISEKKWANGKQSLNAEPCLNSGFGIVYRQNSNNVLKELWSLSSIALLRILLQKCLGLKWQKRLSSPSIKLDKLHKDYPKSAATQLLQWKSHTTKRRSWNTRTRLTWGIATLLAKS